MKLPPKDLNLGLCLPYSTNTYTCRVTIAPKVCGGQEHILKKKKKRKKKRRSMTRLLLLILETYSNIYCDFGNKITAITISYQIRKAPSDSHARHAILRSMQFDCPEMTNHILHLFNFLPKLRCMHISFSSCIACL